MVFRRPPSAFDVKRDILPLFVVSDADGGRVVSYEGTAFLAAPHVAITCWHCVARELLPDQHYAVAVQGESVFYHLMQIERDPSGLDLAIARVDELVPTLGLTVANDEEIGQNLDVVTYGYPLGLVTHSPDGDAVISVPGRVLRGYVTRVFTAQPGDYARTLTIELDMPAPAGLSGAPLLVMGMELKLVGVVYG